MLAAVYSPVQTLSRLPAAMSRTLVLAGVPSEDSGAASGIYQTAFTACSIVVALFIRNAPRSANG
jgi:hypothetical protein